MGGDIKLLKCCYIIAYRQGGVPTISVYAHHYNELDTWYILEQGGGVYRQGTATSLIVSLYIGTDPNIR
jgi:hypothetical protein